MDFVLSGAAFASKASLGIKHAETIVPVALTVASAALYGHMEFASSFQRAFFEHTATEQLRSITPEKNYPASLPAPENYGTFASYLFFGEDALFTCLDEAVITSEERKVVTNKIRDTVDSRARVVVSDFCLDLTDSQAISVAAQPLQSYAANDMFNRIKENWFQNLLIRASLIDTWNSTEKITSVADFGRKISDKVTTLTEIREELKTQLAYSRQILLPDHKQKVYDERLQSTKLTQLLEQRAAYEQFILQRLHGKIIPFLKELTEAVGLEGDEAKVPQTAEEVMRFFAANDISPLSQRVITAADKGSNVEPEDLDKALDLFNNMNAFIARGAKAMMLSDTGDRAHLRTKLFSMMFAGAIYGVNQYSDSIGDVAANMAGAGTGMMGTAMVAISKLLSALFFFPNGPISPLILSPSRITTAGICFSVALGLRVMDIYFSRPVQPLSMSGAAAMLPRSKEGDQISRNASMTQKVFAFSRRMFSGIYQLSSIGTATGLAIAMIGYFADQRWGGGAATVHLLSYVSGTAQEYLTGPVIPWFHIKNIVSNLAGLVTSGGRTWLSLDTPFVWLSPLDIGNILTYFCMFHTAFTTAQLALGVVLDITPTKTTSVATQPKQKVWTWLARTVGLVSNWQILAPVMETLRFYVLSQILNTARSGGFSNISRLVNLNNTGFESEGKYYIPVSTAEYHAFDEHLKLLFMSMGVGPMILRTILLSISGRDALKTIDLPEGEGYLSLKRLQRRTQQYIQVALSPLSLVLTGQTAGMLAHMVIADSLNSVWQLLSFSIKYTFSRFASWWNLRQKEWMHSERTAMAEQFCDDLEELVFFQYTINDWNDRASVIEHGAGQDLGIIGLGFYVHYKEQVEDAGILRPDVAAQLKRVFESVLSEDHIRMIYKDPNGSEGPIFLSDEDVDLLKKAFQSARPILVDYFNDDLVRNPDSWVDNYTRTRALVVREGGWAPLLKNLFFTRDTPLFVGAMLKNFLFMYGAYSMHPDIAHVRESIPFVGASTVQNLAAVNASFGATSSFWAAIGYSDYQGIVRSPSLLQSFSLFSLAMAKSAGYAEIVRSLEDPDTPMDKRALNILYVYLLELITHREFRMLVTDRLAMTVRSLFSKDVGVINPAERTDALKKQSRIDIAKRARRPESIAWKALKYSAIAGLLGGTAFLAAQHAVYDQPKALTVADSQELAAYVPYSGEWRPVAYSFSSDAPVQVRGKSMDDIAEVKVADLEVLDPDSDQPLLVYSAKNLDANKIKKHPPTKWRYVAKFKKSQMNSTNIEHAILQEATIYAIDDIRVVSANDSTGLHLLDFCPVQWLQANAIPLSYTAKGNNNELFMEMQAQAKHTELIEAILRKAGIPIDSSQTPYADIFMWTDKSRTYPQNYLLNKVLLQELVRIHGPEYIDELVELFERSLAVFAPGEHAYSHVTSASPEMKRLIATRVLMTTDFAKRWTKGMTGKAVFEQLNSLAYNTDEATRYQQRDLRLLRVIIPSSWQDMIANLVYRFGVLLNNEDRNEANCRAYEETNEIVLGIVKKRILSDEEIQHQSDNCAAVNQYIQRGDQAQNVRISLYEDRVRQASSELVIGGQPAVNPRKHSALRTLAQFGQQIAPVHLALPGSAIPDKGTGLVPAGSMGRSSLAGTVFVTANAAIMENIARSGESIAHRGVYFTAEQLITLFEPLGSALNNIVLFKLNDVDSVWIAVEPFYYERYGDTVLLVYNPEFTNEESFYTNPGQLMRKHGYVIPGVFTKDNPSGIMYVYAKETLQDIYNSTKMFYPMAHDPESKTWDAIFADCARTKRCGMTARIYEHIRSNEADREWWATWTEGQRLSYLTEQLSAALNAHEDTLVFIKKEGDVYKDAYEDEGQMVYFQDTVVSNDLAVIIDDTNIKVSIENLTEANTTVGHTSTDTDSRWLAIVAWLGDYVINPPDWLKQTVLGTVGTFVLGKLTGFFSKAFGRRTEAQLTHEHTGTLSSVLVECARIRKMYKQALRELHTEMACDIILQTSVELLRKEYHQYVAIDPLALLALDATIDNEPYLDYIRMMIRPGRCLHEEPLVSPDVPDWMSALTDPLGVYLNDRTDVLVLTTHPDFAPMTLDIDVTVDDGIHVTSANIDAYLTWVFIKEQSALKLATMQRNMMKTGIIKKAIL